MEYLKYKEECFNILINKEDKVEQNEGYIIVITKGVLIKINSKNYNVVEINSNYKEEDWLNGKY